MEVIEALNFRNTCLACPTQFEFEDKFDNKYYFRFRWGCWTLYDITNDNEWKSLKSGCFGDNFDGMCSEEEFLSLLREERLRNYN